MAQILDHWARDLFRTIRKYECFVNKPSHWPVGRTIQTSYLHLFTTGIGLQMGHPSYKYVPVVNTFGVFIYFTLCFIPPTLFSIIYHAYVFFIPGVWPHLSEARNSFKIFYLPLYIYLSS
jgi:hypothetical protein